MPTPPQHPIANTQHPILSLLETEQRNPRTRELDTLSTSALVETLHAENYLVADAVTETLPVVAQVVDILAERMARGGDCFMSARARAGVWAYWMPASARQRLE